MINRGFLTLEIFFVSLGSDECFQLGSFVNGQEQSSDHGVQPSSLKLLFSGMQFLDQAYDVLDVELFSFWDLFRTVLLVLEQSMVEVFLLRHVLG